MLLRHGETDGNVAGRLDTRPPGSPLTPAGHRQARDFALAQPVPPGLLLHSVALRAGQTAAEISDITAVGCNEVDGVYDIIPGDRSNMDVLYDMLSSFDEDSVKIYAGLVHPKDGRPAEEPVVVEVEETLTRDTTVHIAPAGAETEPEAEPAPEKGEPEQLSLLGSPEEQETPKPKKGRRRRAAVPSWDEIMFGSPAPKPKD